MTRLLLDTHTVLFWWSGSAKLSATARDAIAADEAEVSVSVASCWEIATKFRLGKLAFAGDPQRHMPRLLVHDGFETLPITAEHALRAGSLPGEHRDPFDRIIAAQALLNDLTVVTRDGEIEQFGCKVLW